MHVCLNHACPENQAELIPSRAIQRFCRFILCAQSAYRDVQTLVKHTAGLYDLQTFNDTKNSLQLHMDEFIQ